MSSMTEDRVNLGSDILNGSISVEEVKKRLIEYEEKYGDDFYNAYSLHKRDKPWDRAYLDDLELQWVNAASSKEFILHMAEVADEVYGHNTNDTNIIKKLQSIEKHRRHTDEMLTKQLNSLTKANDEWQKAIEDSSTKDETGFDRELLDSQRQCISAMKDVMQLLSMMDRYIDHTFGKYKDYTDADKNGSV